MLFSEHYPAILSFLTEIGIPYRETSLPQTTFLAGIEIKGGALMIDPSRLLSPGDILHEAGHIAVAPALERASMTGDLQLAGTEREGEELAAIAWSVGAASHLRVPLEVVFHPDGYKGASDWFLEEYGAGNALFHPLLVWMGLCEKPNPDGSGFPKMTKWIR